jgi:hypothetical protein
MLDNMPVALGVSRGSTRERAETVPRRAFTLPRPLDRIRRVYLCGSANKDSAVSLSRELSSEKIEPMGGKFSWFKIDVYVCHLETAVYQRRLKRGTARALAEDSLRTGSLNSSTIQPLAPSLARLARRRPLEMGGTCLVCTSGRPSSRPRPRAPRHALPLRL